jgi:4-alpha-glucanotransferase
MADIFHALVLNLHQPAGNLEELLETRDWEAREILYAFDRISRSLWGYEDIGRVHLSLSGTLLETLMCPDFQARVHGIIKCGDLLWHLQNECLIQVLGTAYYHPVLPLTPPADWPEQLQRWLGLGQHLFWRSRFPGFWPPELSFSMELIPLLKRLGYRYVIVDSEYVEPLTSMPWEELRYRPHLARYEGESIIVIVRDRQLSDAQLAGMDCGWFISEMHERTKFCGFPPLVTTATDGDNGGWFRNPSTQANFWGAFYQPLLERGRRNETEVRPIFIDDYLNQYGAHGEVRVRTGAWNTGCHHGADFTQWSGSPPQKEALQRVAVTSRALHEAFRRVETGHGDDTERFQRLTEAQWRILRAETSCNFYWGEAWLGRCHKDLDEAWRLLNQPGN